MASREIVVRYGDELSSFAFARVDRSKLYGRKERVILDENGDKCVSAYLTADGAALVPPGGTAHIYVDEHFDTVERSELRAVDDDGNPIEPEPSTLGEPQEVSPVTASHVLDHVVSSVYELDPAALGDALKKALADGELFEAKYNYREGYDPDALFLMQTSEGIFGLVARPTGFSFLAREAPVLDEVDAGEEDELEDDLDFSMM